MRRIVQRGPRATPASRFGARLAHERGRRALSMTKLAQMAGTHASEISRLERGLRDPRLSTVDRLARALELSMCDLLRDENPWPGRRLG
jgi:transcriptional regulator with XRE-family HTH domain